MSKLKRFISIRVVKGIDEDNACENIIDENFDEDDLLCDWIIPLTPELRALITKLHEETNHAN